MSKANIWARKKARRALVQAVYQWQLSGHTFTSVKHDFMEGDALKKADVEFFSELLQHVLYNVEAVDAHFAERLDRPLAQLDQVELAILRLATVEFAERIDVPYRVVIDEYVELAKTFGAQDSHKYINGVLDALALSLRPLETAARG